MHKKSYFESFCLGRTRPQHFSCVLVKKGAIAGKALVLNQVDHKDSKVGRGVCKDETRSQRAAKASLVIRDGMRRDLSILAVRPKLLHESFLNLRKAFSASQRVCHI